MTYKFSIDQQTAKDIHLYELFGSSIWSYFDRAVTGGGEEYLRHLFKSPSLDLEEIKDRHHKSMRLRDVIDLDFPFYRVVMVDMEKYVAKRHSGVDTTPGIMDILGVRSPIFYYKKRSILEIADFLVASLAFYQSIVRTTSYADIEEIIALTKECLDRLFKAGRYNVDKLKVTILNIDRLDRLLRYELANSLKRLIHFFYEIDAYRAIARVAREYDLCYPEVFEKDHTGEIVMEEVYHLFHQKPIKNDVKMVRSKRIWFLTGANMAGKSSFIKTFSTALYLTHVGFPVPAKSVRTDLIDGLFTSINLQDNLELGYSHFYVEAVRLKSILEQLEMGTNALIILDELFKGTNHSDASHAIFDILQNLAQTDGPYVIVSSHITELSTQLKGIPQIDYMKMNIESDEAGQPKFTYKIAQGVADEKLGMWLLRKSGAFEAIDRLKPK